MNTRQRALIELAAWMHKNNAFFEVEAEGLTINFSTNSGFVSSYEFGLVVDSIDITYELCPRKMPDQDHFFDM